ncbi:hypothetical protein GIB67_003145 [Kingdonia uniflora]|uniref:Retrotransposon Copia-like N-terminal domain-containing protein n=1 Tax=Kingdonia uniflora TaxID=39325 RepID=A0A7J7N5V7_9MAGN|nr:hypothetical protein GIB67_003145 [Kingdonia uniflora]
MAIGDESSLSSSSAVSLIRTSEDVQSFNSVHDNPNLKITSQLLDGLNYVRWVQSMKLFVGGRGKIGFLLGTKIEPAETNPKYILSERIMLGSFNFPMRLGILNRSRQSPMPHFFPSAMTHRYAYPAPPSVPSQILHTSSPSPSPLPVASGNSPPRGRSVIIVIENTNEVLKIYSLDAEFSRPFWVFGISSYDLIRGNGNDLIACSYRQNGRSYLGILDDETASLSVLGGPFTDINNMICGGDYLYVEGASEIHPLSIVKVSLDYRELKAVDFSVIWSSFPDSMKYKLYFSLPELIEFPTEIRGQNAYAYFYPPSNPIYQSGPEEKPPLLLKSHGGPTDEARGILNLNIQYWTSRGWAFVDVNYGGSSGVSYNFTSH